MLDLVYYLILNLPLILIALWILRTAKSVLFWIYLWQLKEYHIGRFIDHFRTYKGKKIFINWTFGLKIISLALFFTDSSYPFFILFFIYVAEVSTFLVGKAKNPTWTKKTIFLFLILAIVSALFLFNAVKLDSLNNTQLILVFDILTPFITSLVVLLVQPFFVLGRNEILKKAKRKISKFKNLTVIGITGSYGKTSTKEFLATILSSKFNVLATKDHKNSEVGIAKTILDELKPEHRIFVAEMGAYKKGGISLLCDIVKPKIGIVTGVNEQHLSTFGSMDNLLSAEGGIELLESLPNNGLLLVNGDNKYCLDLYKRARTIGGRGIPILSKIYAISANRVNSDIWAEEISIKERSLDFVAVTKEKEAVHIVAKALGKQNIQNLLGAILAAKEIGMSLEEISLGVKNIKQEQAGIVLKRGVNGINIIDSSYSSNPDGVIADLDYLSVFGSNPSTGLKVKKVVVMPCLIELGKMSSKIHEQIGKKIAEVCDMAIIVTKDRFNDIKLSATNEGMSENKVLFSEKPREILNLITTSCKEGDTILLEGRVPSEVIKLLEK